MTVTLKFGPEPCPWRHAHTDRPDNEDFVGLMVVSSNGEPNVVVAYWENEKWLDFQHNTVRPEDTYPLVWCFLKDMSEYALVHGRTCFKLAEDTASCEAEVPDHLLLEYGS